MDLCHQARRHYLSRCWPYSISAYGVTRPILAKCRPFLYNRADTSLFLGACAEAEDIDVFTAEQGIYCQCQDDGTQICGWNLDAGDCPVGYAADTSKMRRSCYPEVFLTHWDRDKVAAISQTTFSYAFSWIRMFEFRLIFHWILFLGI